MTSAALSFSPAHAAGRPAPRSSLDGYFVALAGALAISGLMELMLQRIVYRVGLHIPRDGAFLDAYVFATRSGDFAFRATAVLLAVAAVAGAVSMYGQRDRAGAAFLATLVAANLLAWPLGLAAGGLLAPLLFAFAAAWIAGRSLGQGGHTSMTCAVLAAVAALACSQYVAGMTALDASPTGLSTTRAFGELGLLLAAGLAGWSAAARRRRAALIASAALTLLLVASYAREAGTFAIVSMWATGFTMSLPPVLYFAGISAAVFAAATWVARPETRHLSAGLALLLVAGLQPQALHHGVTAILGLMLLSTPASRPQKGEATNAA